MTSMIVSETLWSSVKTFGLTEFIDDIQISIYNLIQIAVTFVGDSDNDGRRTKGFSL